MPDQIKRLLILFGVLGIGLVAARFFLVPATFGKYGHYRAAAIDAVVAQSIQYAGHQACADCHEDLVDMKLASRHRTVTCEVCHGPAAAHTEAPDEHELPAPRQRSYCPLCHEYNASRPTGFPQIDPRAHNPMKPCMSCHNPHDPVPPHVPEECGACHGEIARSKAVSHHALLLCTTCHETHEEHKVHPRLVRPSKPSTSAFCGRCHGEDADSSKEIPRIDLATHGENYLCWQCHYPHYPEAH